MYGSVQTSNSPSSEFIHLQNCLNIPGGSSTTSSSGAATLVSTTLVQYCWHVVDGNLVSKGTLLTCPVQKTHSIDFGRGYNTLSPSNCEEMEGAATLWHTLQVPDTRFLLSSKDKRLHPAAIPPLSKSSKSKTQESERPRFGHVTTFRVKNSK